MINELLWIGLLLFSYAGIIFAYKFFGKAGLYSWITMSVILANIQVLKTIELFTYVTALGNIIYGSIFLITDILNENHGKKDAKKAVFLGFFMLIVTTIIMQISIQFVPHESDQMSEHISAIFGLFIPILVASLSAYIISQLFDVWFYQKIKSYTKGKKLWLRNNLSTMVSQLIDNLIFTGMFFVGYFLMFEPASFLGWEVVSSIFWMTIAMKYVVAVLDTPFIYIAKKIKEKNGVN